MISANFRFIGIGDLTETTFFQCPIWMLYEDPDQDEMIKSWGVDLEKAWETKEETEENEYYFPYLGKEKLSLTRGIYLYCMADLASGHQLFGYLTGGFAFCVFYKGKKYLFNKNMPDFGKETAAQLADALANNINTLFPIKFKPVSYLSPGEVMLEKFW
ncbi:MAG: hypothetical protein AB2689_27300 [Candidatus Thiodiazotropha taylori]